MHHVEPSTGWRGAYAERLRARNAARIDSLIAPAAAAAGAREARDAAPNLDSSTRVSQHAGYSVTVMDFGDGLVEARAVFLDQRVRVKAKKDQTLASAEKPIDEGRRAEKLEWARRRSARKLRYRCLALKADHMITLTKRGKFASFEEVRTAWRAFYKLLRKFPNLEFRYVAVPELHGDRETWHLHVAVQGRYDVVFLRRLWYRALGGRGDETGAETPGSIQIQYFRSRRKASSIVAAYMAKYMGKSFEACGGSGRKAFWCSEGLVPQKITRYFEPAGDCALWRVRDVVAPMVPKNTLWRVFEWEYVGLHGFIMKTY